jgi:hypothetical protein
MPLIFIVETVFLTSHSHNFDLPDVSGDAVPKSLISPCGP